MLKTLLSICLSSKNFFYKNVYNIFYYYKHQEKNWKKLFSIYLYRLQLRSFCDFIVVCNVTWQYFKDIIIFIYQILGGILDGLLLSSGWEF